MLKKLIISYTDEQIQQIAMSLFVYLYNLLQDNNDCEQLLESLQKNSVKIHKESKGAYWKESIFPEFIFESENENDGYNICVHIDSYASSKKYFGFMMYIHKNNNCVITNKVYWSIAINDSLGGDSATIASEVLASKMKKIFKAQKIKCHFTKNGVPSIKERILNWILYS